MSHEPSSAPEGDVPIEETMTRLGETRLEVLALSREGVMMHRSGAFRFYVSIRDLCVTAEAFDG